MKWPLLFLMIFLTGCNGNAQKEQVSENKPGPSSDAMIDHIPKNEKAMSNENNKNPNFTGMTETEWKQRLTEEQFRILREKGTEMPHTGKYNLHFKNGEYHCAGCGTKLFESGSKFKSNCGWPSFDEAIEGAVEYKKDTGFGMIRTEIVCANCGGHLGHVFDDGPTETGQRYCINSASLDFDPE